MEVALSYLVSAFQIEAASLTTQNGNDHLYSFKQDEAKTETESEPVKPLLVSYFFSNLATAAVIEMLANGAEHGSEQQKVLLDHSHGKPLDWINEIFPLTVEFLTETGNACGPRIKYTTAIWVDRSVKLKEPFNKVIRDIYKPDFYSQEFTNTKVLKREVNGWAQEKTRGLIKDSLGSHIIEDDTRLILAAALDFEGEWLEPFQDAGVQKFNLLNGKNVDMPFMTSKGKHYVKQFPDYKLLSIPYKQNKASSFSMLFYLPDNIQDTQKLQDFIGQQESVILDAYFPEEQVQVGNFLIPKFSLSVSGPMPLQDEAGKPFGFEQMANSFAGLISRGGMLSSFLEINERGTKAAGVSCYFVDEKPQVPKVAPRSSIQPCSIGKIQFVANRPFIFFIRDNRFGRMLFSGALINPVGELCIIL